MTRSLLAAASLGLFALHAGAQAYPSKPIQVLIASVPGGGTDAIGRVLADALAAYFKQTVVPVNRAGASGTIASESLVRAPADGYTLMVQQNGHTTNPALFRKLPYDTFSDFTPISTLGRAPLVLVAAAGTGVSSMKELADLGKRKPDSMSFGVSEASTRLATEMISGATGIPMTAVNYKGTGPAMTDLAGGHVGFSVTTIASTLGMRGAGKFQYLGVLAAQRTPFLPEVPSMAEQGLPDIEAGAWWGVFAPAKMPPALLQTLSTAVRAAMGEADFRKRVMALSIEPWTSTPEEFERFIRKEVDLNLRLAKKAGMEPE
jgi:tripartite-type tricarboxylate transporter receptor subunit TctC